VSNVTVDRLSAKSLAEGDVVFELGDFIGAVGEYGLAAGLPGL
jgi:hypothetical protein